MMSSATKRERWLVIDTDAGVDDSVAICYAIRHCAQSNLELKLVLTTHGNIKEDLVYTNVMKTMWACEQINEHGISVKRGASVPLRGDSDQIYASYFHGADGLGSVCSTSYGMHKREEAAYRRLGLQPNDEGTDAVAELLLLCDRASKISPPAEVHEKE